MLQRIDWEMQYVERCERNGTSVDWDRVVTGLSHAYASGIVTGTCEDKAILEMPVNVIHDKHFMIIIDALTRHIRGKEKKSSNFTLKFPTSQLTDKSLEALANAIKNDNFPAYVTIDLSSSNRITDAGVKTLLDALSDKQCNLSVNIKLPENPRRINPALIKELNTKLEENKSQYIHAPDSPIINKTGNKKSRKTVFSRDHGNAKSKKNEKTEDKNNKQYFKLGD